jgi:hypothetical protein
MSYENYHKLKVVKLPVVEKEISLCPNYDTISNSKFCPECGTKNESKIQKIELDALTIISQLREKTDAGHYINSKGGSEEPGSWDLESDMKSFSRIYPTAVFQIDVQWDNGLGEPPSRYYFHDGKQQTCKTKVSFDDFDLKKLK